MKGRPRHFRHEGIVEARLHCLGCTIPINRYACDGILYCRYRCDDRGTLRVCNRILYSPPNSYLCFPSEIPEFYYVQQMVVKFVL